MIYFMLIFLLLLAVCWFIGNFFYNFGVNTKTDKSALFTAEPKCSAEEQARRDSSHAEDAAFLAEHPAKQIHIKANHAPILSLRAQEISQDKPSAKWALLVHGYGSMGSNMLREARSFYKAGFNILLPDLRGHGESEGAYVGMGWPDHYDILDWIAYLTKQYPESEILLYGVSMGAATVMNVSGEALPDNVKVIIEDCGYTSVADIFGFHLKRIFHQPRFPVLYIASAVIHLRAGYSIFAPGPIDQVAKSKTPILFIHGDADTFVPYFMLDQVYAAAACPKQKLVIPGASHAQAEFTDPERYWQTVWAFANPYFAK